MKRELFIREILLLAVNKHRIIAFVPMRGGSKSIKQKNYRELGSKPLLAWPIEIAHAVPEIDRVIVSTDCETIAKLSRQYGAEVYIRPAYLATDRALVIDVIRHMRDVLWQEGESNVVMVLLEATAPFRSAHLIRRCLQRLMDENLDSIATFHAATTHPHRAWRIDGAVVEPFIENAIPWLPRQELPPAYQLSGAVYAFKLDKLPEDSPGLLFGKVGAEIVNTPTIDIDNEEDFLIANTLLESGKIAEIM